MGLVLLCRGVAGKGCRRQANREFKEFREFREFREFFLKFLKFLNLPNPVLVVSTVVIQSFTALCKIIENFFAKILDKRVFSVLYLRYKY